jgi:hypothetical protein
MEIDETTTTTTTIERPLVIRANASLAPLLAKVDDLQRFAAVFAVEGDDDEAIGHEALGEAKALIRQFDDVRKEVVADTTKAIAEVNARFREAVAPLRVVRERFEEALAAHHAKRVAAERAARQREQAQREQAQREQAQAIAASAQPAAALTVAAPAPVKVATTAVAGSYKAIFTAQIVDPSAVPDVYWRPDLALVQRAVDEGARSIPGVEIVESVQVNNRRK